MVRIEEVLSGERQLKKHYLTRDGRKVILHDEQKDKGFLIGTIRLKDGREMSYTWLSDGHLTKYGKSSADLIMDNKGVNGGL